MENCNIMKQVLYCSCMKCYTFIEGDVISSIKCDLHQLPAFIAPYLYLHSVILSFTLQIFIMQSPCATHTYCFPSILQLFLLMFWATTQALEKEYIVVIKQVEFICLGSNLDSH